VETIWISLMTHRPMPVSGDLLTKTSRCFLT
jgi:hypothetical protein